MTRNWRELVWLVVFVLLFGAAMVANLSDSSRRVGCRGHAVAVV